MTTEMIRVLLVTTDGAARVETIPYTKASFEAHTGGPLDAFSLGVEGTVCFCKRGHAISVVPGFRAVYGTYLVAGDAMPECCDLTDAQIESVQEVLKTCTKA